MNEGERHERGDVEEQDEADVAAAGRCRELVAAAAPFRCVLVRQVGRDPQGVHAEPRQAAVHRLQEVVAAAAEVGVRVRARPIDRVAAGVVDERRLERVDRRAHVEHAPHVLVVEQQRHKRRLVYGLTIEP